MNYKAIRMTKDLFDWMSENGYFPDLPVGEPAEGYVAREGYDEDRDGGLFPVYGAYVDADALLHHVGRAPSPNGPPLGAASVCILGNGDGAAWSYTPIGQHSDFAFGFLVERAYLISIDAYKAIAGSRYTPQAYLETLSSWDPFTSLMELLPSWDESLQPDLVEFEWPPVGELVRAGPG